MRRNRERGGEREKAGEWQGGIIKKKRKRRRGNRRGVTADEEGEFSWKPW